MSVSVNNNTKDDIVSTQSRTVPSPVLLHIFACVSMCDFVQITSTYLSNYLENSTRYSAEGKKGSILTLSVESRCYNFSFCIKETTDASAGVWYFCCVAWYLINKDAYYLFITLQNAKCMDPSNASFFFLLKSGKQVMSKFRYSSSTNMDTTKEIIALQSAHNAVCEVCSRGTREEWRWEINISFQCSWSKAKHWIRRQNASRAFFCSW